VVSPPSKKLKVLQEVSPLLAMPRVAPLVVGDTKEAVRKDVLYGLKLIHMMSSPEATRWKGWDYAIYGGERPE
jgi:hypothetical protein